MILQLGGDFLFILTFKLPRRRFFAGTVAALCLAAATVRLPSPAPAVPAGVFQSVGKLRRQKDRAEFLRSLGYPVADAPLSEEKLVIPREMEDSEYLALQRKQGFDLPALAGQRVTRYVYALENNGETGRFLELLLLEDRVVGGSVYSAGPEGTFGPLFPAD